MQGFILILLIFICSIPTHKVFADVPLADRMQIRQDVKTIERSLSQGSIQGVFSLISPHALPGLKEEMEEVLADKKINFNEDDISSWTVISPTTVRIDGNFSASGTDWKMNGLGNYFIFEKINGRWLLLDTDFYLKFSPKYWGEFMRSALSYALPIFIVTFAFWVWMLIDCLNRPVKDKLIWVLLLIFLNLLGAILYFFIERNKTKQIQGI